MLGNAAELTPAASSESACNPARIAAAVTSLRVGGGWGVGCRQFIDAIQKDVTNSEIPASAAVARLARRFHVDHPGVIMALLLFPVSPLEHQQATNFVRECKGYGCIFSVKIN